MGQTEFTIEMMIDDQEGKAVGSYISPILKTPMDKKDFKVSIKLGHHNLAKGKYKVNFNIGLKSEAFAYMDFDLIYDVLSFEVAYSEKATKAPLTVWQYSWGNNKYTDGTVTIE